ncbi:LT_GEWL domain containing protein [uncultured Caudovirales phage]|uniref:LT_GEWL domain containing protein n=1 Tax=uncultured Caudovirales phage TaxID=2100421 RepID=A0A6J7WYB7_9CAUD|nr:LT_GEWL domain containing protein [uncultured Caudovirales phage]
MGGGGKSSTSSQTVSIPPEVLARYNAVNKRAEDTANQQFQPYTGEFVAGLDPSQQAGIANTNAAANQAQPAFQQGMDMTSGAARNVGPLTQQQIAYYQNPYTQAVVDPTIKALQQQQGQQLAGQQGQAIMGGAFGGDRANIARAQLQGQQSLGLSQAISPLYQQGYNTAVQTATGQQGVVASDLARQMQAGQQLANLGQGAQSAALQGAQAQIGAGTLGQQTQQASDTARYQQHLQQQGYPFQVAQFLANIAEGTGALSGSTTTTTQPAGFFSDERLKEDVKKIGKTNDGQPIYSYKYKGDDRTQIGLMAQDVEKRNPDAVGLMGGYKTVDYKKATEDSERPAKYAGGGLVPDGFDPSSMGGAVGSDMAGEGFARGGDAIGPYASAGLYSNARSYVPHEMKHPHAHHFAMGGTPYGSSYVPDAGPQQERKLMLPAALPSAPKTGLSSAMEMGKNISGMYTMGKSGLIGSAPTKDDPTGSAGLIGGQGSFSGQNAFSKLGDWLKPGAAHGGLIVGHEHYAAGGDVDPYEESKDPLKDVLHTQESAKHGSLSTPNAPQGGGSQSSGLGKMAGSLIGSAFGPFGSMAGGFLGGFLPFAEGGLIPRQGFAGDDGESGAVLPLDPAVVEAQPGLAPVVEEATPAVIPAKMKGLVVDRPSEPKYTPEELSKFGNASIQHIIGTESGGDPRARATTSSAAGLGQFTDSTARTVLQRHPEIAQGIDYNPKQRGFTATLPVEVQQAMIAAHAADQAGVLAKHGFEPTPQNIKANWFFGEAGGPAFLKGLQRDPSAPGHLLAGADQVNANQGVFFNKDGSPRTAQEVMDKLNAGGGGGGGRGPTPPGLIGRGMQPAPSESGEPGLIDKATSANFVVPALGFLGSMLASQRPTLGGALGEGLLGGTGAYMSQQKQQAEMAKGTFDLIKSRFTRGTDDNGNTFFFDTVRGQKVPASVVDATGAAMLRARGVNPADYGFSGTAIPQVPGIPAPSGGATSGAPAPAQPDAKITASGTVAPAQPGQPPAPPSQDWMSQPPEKANLFDRSEGELIAYAKTPQGAAHFGLAKTDRDPVVLQADINKRLAYAQNVLRTGDPEQKAAAEAERVQANKDQDRLNGYLKDAVGLQYSQNQELAKLDNQTTGEFNKEVIKRGEVYQLQKDNLKRLADIYSNYSAGRLADVKAQLTGVFSSLGIPQPADWASKTPNYDQAIKLATQQAFQAVSDNSLSRAPKDALGRASALTADPSKGIDPGAAYALIGRTLGEMEYIHDRDIAYRKAGRGVRPLDFVSDYNDKVDYKPYIAKAFNGPEAIPVGKGVTEDVRRSLGKTYGFEPRAYNEVNAPAGGQPAAAPAASAAPEPIRNLQGLEYSPRRNQYRDAQGNIYDASGKRVQ